MTHKIDRALYAATERQREARLKMGLPGDRLPWTGRHELAYATLRRRLGRSPSLDEVELAVQRGEA